MVSQFHFSLSLTSPSETAKLAEALATRLRAHDTLLLSGDIGAGKTHFARALIRARLAVAGVVEDIPSPTYTLVQTYHDGICEIWHADLYRICDSEEIPELGLADAFESGLCLVEWPENLGPYHPENPLVFSFSHTDDPQSRKILLADEDHERRKRLRPALAPFMEPAFTHDD